MNLFLNCPTRQCNSCNAYNGVWSVGKIAALSRILRRLRRCLDQLGFKFLPKPGPSEPSVLLSAPYVWSFFFCNSVNAIASARCANYKYKRQLIVIALVIAFTLSQKNPFSCLNFGFLKIICWKQISIQLYLLCCFQLTTFVVHKKLQTFLFYFYSYFYKYATWQNWVGDNWPPDNWPPDN